MIFFQIDSDALPNGLNVCCKKVFPVCFATIPSLILPLLLKKPPFLHEAPAGRVFIYENLLKSPS